jgi:hypothetical protein
MTDRLAGRASAAIAEQRDRLEAEARVAAEARVKAAQDSARAVLERTRRAAEDSLRRRAGGAIQNFFGTLGGKKGGTPATAPLPADTAGADTTGR